MNFCSQVCHRIPSDPLNPKYFCKAWDGEGSPLSSCIGNIPIPEDCEFLVTPTQRVIPWIHGEVKDEKVETKTNKRQEKKTAKRRTADKD